MTRNDSGATINEQSVRVERPSDTGVHRRMEEDCSTPQWLELHPDRLEIREHAADLVAAGHPKILQRMTDLASLGKIGRDTFGKAFSGARMLDVDHVALMVWLGRRYGIPEAKGWCLAFAGALAGKFGYRLAPVDGTTSNIAEISSDALRASAESAAQLMRAMADGVCTPVEAVEILPTVQKAIALMAQSGASLQSLAATAAPRTVAIEATGEPS